MEDSHALGAPTDGPAAGHVVTDHEWGCPSFNIWQYLVGWAWVDRQYIVKI